MNKGGAELGTLDGKLGETARWAPGRGRPRLRMGWRAALEIGLRGESDQIVRRKWRWQGGQEAGQGNRFWQHERLAISTFTISSQLSDHNGNHIERRKRPPLPAVIPQEGLLASPASLAVGLSCSGGVGVRPRWASLEWVVGSLLAKCTV